MTHCHKVPFKNLQEVNKYSLLFHYTYFIHFQSGYQPQKSVNTYIFRNTYRFFLHLLNSGYEKIYFSYSSEVEQNIVFTFCKISSSQILYYGIRKDRQEPFFDNFDLLTYVTPSRLVNIYKVKNVCEFFYMYNMFFNNIKFNSSTRGNILFYV